MRSPSVSAEAGDCGSGRIVAFRAWRSSRDIEGRFLGPFILTDALSRQTAQDRMAGQRRSARTYARPLHQLPYAAVPRLVRAPRHISFAADSRSASTALVVRSVHSCRARCSVARLVGARIRECVDPTGAIASRIASHTAKESSNASRQSSVSRTCAKPGSIFRFALCQQHGAVQTAQLYGHPQAGAGPICAMSPNRSSTCHRSVILPSRTTSTLMPETDTGLPLAGTPSKSPRCVPESVKRVTTVSPSQNCASRDRRRSGIALRIMPITCTRPAAPGARPGNPSRARVLADDRS
jgi:hypothetical protein